jgi:glycosyltransferase involved in cell wall biosynthesis
MKVLIVNTYDTDGGAARAAYRLHNALLFEGVQSVMLVQKKLSNDLSIQSAVSIKQKIIAKLKPYIDQLPLFFYKKKSANLFSTAWISFGDILSQINAFKPDIVHLHWIAKGVLSIEEIGRIKVPIVWTMHDSWAFTGGCHIPEACVRYKSACGSCPVLGSNNTNDLSSKILKKKHDIFSSIHNMTIVGVSRWLQACAQSSSLFKDKNVHCIPNPINTELFFPIKKLSAKKKINIRNNKHLILFGAASATSDLNKGFAKLIEAINQLPIKNVELVVFGNTDYPKGFFCKYKTHFLGYINDDIFLKNVYSAADVMVVPSLIEAFGQSASEAMACGTPVVAFNTTGLVDIVEHKKNGYLAQSYDTSDLANGIKWVLSSTNYPQLSVNARNTVLAKFDNHIVASAYKALYTKILKEGI